MHTTGMCPGLREWWLQNGVLNLHNLVIFKALYQLCPGYPRDWFVFAEAYTGHSGRNKCHLFIPQINTSIGKNGFFIVEL